MLRRPSFFILFFYILISVCSCNSPSTKENNNAVAETKFTNNPPDWIMQGNIYEVNIRQYTTQGSFKAFEKNLERLKEMGVQILWFMPINPISKLDHKGELGSYYAVADYKKINPEFGTIEDWKELVSHAHAMGFKVIMDWVPNHTGADHPWLKDHPNFYVKDSVTGKPLSPFDWTDVRQLDFTNKEMQDSMAAAMKFWVTTDIDGFRCDHIEKFQEGFWKWAIPELKKQKNLLMLAEADDSWVYTVGFDMDYGWKLFHTTVDIAAGKRTALSIDTIMSLDSSLPKNALQLYFTSNHDENSWNKADYGTMPGASHAPFAVFTQTLPHGVPLIYSGQEEPVLDSISFFYKDAIHFKNYGRAKFYKTLLALRNNNAALSTTASFKKIKAGDEKALFAYVREAGGKKVLVILNLSRKEQAVKISDASLLGNPYNVFKGDHEALTANEWKIQPWGYVVYVY